MSPKAPFEEEHSDDGGFQRQEDAFREWVSRDASGPFPAAAGRYHLYISLACPWAHRTLIARNLKGLEDAVGVTVVDPVRDERGWAFREGPGFSRDPVNGFDFLREAYTATDPDFHGRVTVPVLWDRETRRIVNNSEDDICRMFNGAFADFGKSDVNLFPERLEAEHSGLSAFLYETVNNGVYRAGFATTQAAYEASCRTLFSALDELENRLSGTRYLLGREPVEADWRLFCTLIRFDAVYHGHFKCNVRRIVDFPNLDAWLRDLYQQPGIAGTVNFQHIKRHYYITHGEINPTRIVPLGPELHLDRPHGRDRMPQSAMA
ncbi:MAG: glutathione S-transferase family protein [Verrucomicrobiota bacterium]